MSMITPELIARCQKLGIECDDLPADTITSAVATLACFPMYMVANAHAWAGEPKGHVSLLDWPRVEQIREAFELGSQQGPLDLERPHSALLATLLKSAKPSDLVIYEYALETLRGILAEVPEAVANALRAGIAKMVVDVAKASGDGLLGSGPPISDSERACIGRIVDELALTKSAAAKAVLEALNQTEGSS